MGYRRYVPGAPLAEYVACIWLYEADILDDVYERCLPTGAADLVVNLRAAPLSVFPNQDLTCPQFTCGPLLYGPHSEFFVMQRCVTSSVLGVHFRPGGAAALFRTPADELHNRALPLEALWGARANELHEQLLIAGALHQRFRIIERALLAQLSRALAPHPAVVWALRELQRTGGKRTVAALSKRIGLSARRLSQVFGESVGLTPKLFGRIQRFQAVVAHLQRPEPMVWAQIALRCGYFDQAHFARDFRAFSGLSPTAYFASRGPWPNHVALRT